MNPRLLMSNRLPRLAFALVLLCACTAISIACANSSRAANDRARFIGAWDLVSVEALWPGGKITAPWGAHPPGRLIYTREGRMLVLCMHDLRNQAGRKDFPPALQNEAAGYFGTYTVDSTTHVVSHHVEATLRSAESGTINRTYEFKNNKLYLSANAMRDGLPVTYILAWKQA